jgi:glycosyltransferase involved in cell wall biosynthesis
MRAFNWVAHCIAMTWCGITDRERIDFVYAPYGEIISVALAAFLVSRFRRVPMIFCNLNVRGVPLWTFNRFLHKRADLIITLSDALMTELRDAGITAPVKIGLVGVEDESIPRQAPLYDALYVGRHTPAKGIFDIVRVWARCVASQPTLQLALAGHCAEDVRNALTRMLNQLGIQDNVTLLGPVTEEQKWALYARSRVCVFPSHVEGWGIVPIEAHLAGIPVVAYDLDAYAATIRHSPSARLVPDGDVDAFALAVADVLGRPYDPEPSRIWAQQFTWAQAVAREVELLRGFLAGD